MPLWKSIIYSHFPLFHKKKIKSKKKKKRVDKLQVSKRLLTCYNLHMTASIFLPL